MGGVNAARCIRSTILLVKSSRGLVIVDYIYALVVPGRLEGFCKGKLVEIGIQLARTRSVKNKKGEQTGVIVGVMDNWGVGWSALGNPIR
jgi:hypothetical protein